MSTTKLNIGKIPISKGEYQEGTAYQRLNQVTMLGSTYQSKIDDNTSAPARMDADGVVENINTDKWLCIAVGNVSAAKKVVYNNETSGLEAGNVQEAIDEVDSKFSDLFRVTPYLNNKASSIGENGALKGIAEYWKLQVIPVYSGDIVDLDISIPDAGPAEYTAYAFYNSAEFSINTWVYNGDEENTYKRGARTIKKSITVPEGAKYLAITSDSHIYKNIAYRANRSIYKFNNAPHKAGLYAKLLEDNTVGFVELPNIAKIEKSLFESTSVQYEGIKTAVAVKGNGDFIPFSPSWNSYIFNVEEYIANGEYSCNIQWPELVNSGSSAKRNYAIYNGYPSSDTLISGYGVATVDVIPEGYEYITLPKNAKYIAVTGYKAILPNVSFFARDTQNKAYDNIVNAWGDSVMTQVQDFIKSLFPSDKYTFGRYGVGGENAQEIAARAGGIQMLLQNDTTLPIDKSAVTIGHYSQAEGGTGIISAWNYETQLRIHRSLSYDSVNPVTVKGVKCNLKWVGKPGELIQPEDAKGIVTLTPTEELSEPVVVKSMTPIVPRGVIEYNNIYLNILWIGHNRGYETPQDLVEMNKAIINTNNSNRYIVIIPHGLAVNYLETRKLMQKAFGSHFWDWQQWAYNYGLSVNNLQPTEEDTQAMSQYKMLPSLLEDTVHLNDYGKNAFNVGITEKLKELGYV